MRGNIYFTNMSCPEKQPRVSVLMAVYNGEAFLHEAIESVLKQTFYDFEFLIVDDGSTDGSAGIIRSFRDPRIVLIRNIKNVGVPESVNRAWDLARGEYVARMDADDICYPQRLQRQVDQLDLHPNIGLCGTWVKCFGSRQDIFRFPEDHESIRIDLLFDNPIAQPSVMFRKNVFKEHGLRYDPHWRYTEDYDLWLRAGSHCRLSNIPEILLLYRIHPNQQTKARELLRLSENRLIMERQLSALGFLPSEKDLAFHCETATGQIPPKAESLCLLDRHFRKIMEANASTKYYCQTRLRRYLAKRYYGALKETMKRDRIPWNIFIRSILTPVLPFPVKAIAIRKFVSNRLQRLILRLFSMAGGFKGIMDYYCHGNPSGLFFFFPFCCVGGADRVHADIVRSVGDKKPWIIFTGIMPDRGFEPLFAPHAILCDISRSLLKPRRKSFQTGYWAAFIRLYKNPTLFGCNSHFFYDLVRVLDGKARCIDLIHAFAPDGLEIYSLPCVAHLEKRVIITAKTKKDLSDLYAANNIDPRFLERIELIENRVAVPPVFPEKQRSAVLNVLYVGRGTEEKRVHLIARASAVCAENKIPAHFRFVGVFRDAVPFSLQQHCDFKGLVVDTGELTRFYLAADILILTSAREGFPMVIMEAMAQGVVPLSTPVGGIPLCITDNENGILIHGTGENEIVDCIVRQIKRLSTDRAALEKLSQNAYAYAKKYFDPKDFFKKYRALLLAASQK